MKKTLLSIFVALSGVAVAQENATMLVPPEAPYQKEFGTSIAIAPNSSKIAIGSEFGNLRGTVYLYNSDTFDKKLIGSQIDANSIRFGESVALNEKFLFAGDWSYPLNGGSNYGKVHIFKAPNNDGNFNTTPIQTLTGAVNYGRFGDKVIVRGNWLAVVSTGTSSSIFLYKEEGPTNQPWVLKQQIQISDLYNQAVALDDNHLVVGTNGELRVYQKQGNQFNHIYTRAQGARPSWATTGYGAGVTINDGKIVIADKGAGKAEVLTGWGSNWSSFGQLTSPNYPTDKFGASIVIKDNYIILSDYFAPKIYVFEKSGSNYTFKHELGIEHDLITRSKAGEIAINNQSVLVAATPHTTFPGVANSSGSSSSDRGTAFIGNFFNLVKSVGQAYEYNDNIYNAQQIELYRPVKAAISNANDNDYYKVTIAEAQTVSFELSNLPADYDIAIYQSASNQIQSSTLYGLHNEYTALYLNPGTYYVKVYSKQGAANSTQPYSLVVRGSNCVEFVDLNNHSAQTAISLAQTASGLLLGTIKEVGEEDWFSFNHYSSSNFPYKIEVSLSNLIADFDIYLYDENLSEIARSWNGGYSNEFISTGEMPTGKYYVRVDGWSSAKSDQCYHLSIESTSVSSGSSRVSSETTTTKKEALGLIAYPNYFQNGKEVMVSLECGEVKIPSTRIKLLQSGTSETIWEENVNVVNGKATINLPAMSPGLYLLYSPDLGNTKIVVQ